MTPRKAFERRIVALMDRTESVFVHDGAVVVPKVIVSTVEDCWVALCRDHDHDRTEHLIQVAGFLLARERVRFETDPRKYVERSKELAAA